MPLGLSQQSPFSRIVLALWLTKMKKLILFIYALPLLALQDGDFSGSNFLSFSGPIAPQTDYRVEFRLRAFSAAGVQGIFGNNAVGPHCLLVTGTVTLRCRDFAGAGDPVDISLTARTDVRVRFQRFYSTGVRLLEVWNSDGSNYTSNSITNAVAVTGFDTTQYVGAYYGAGSTCDCTIGFLRWWSTTVAAASSAPPDSAVTKGDMVDLELEGNTTDSSGRSISITTTGGALSYATTTTYAPSAVISYTGAARAGSTFALSGATSSNLTDDQPLSYFWQAPTWTTAAPTFSTRTASTTTMTVPTAQTVTVRLRVTDTTGQVGTVDSTVGVVATDSSSRVSIPDATVAIILGPQLRSGAGPWTAFENNEQAIARALIATIPESPGDTPAAGTITFTSGSSAITGSGTNFTSTFACNGTDSLVAIYPLGGGAYGRRAYIVTGCSSTTAATIYPNYDAPSSPVSPSGVQYQQMSNGTSASWVNGSNNWNYYDAVVAFYRLYYRTGDTTYRDAARSLADKWWLFPIDKGNGSVSGARSIGLVGLMLRANDGRSDMWPGIVSILNTNYSVWLNGYYPFQPNLDIGEIREQGYVALYTQVLSMLHPDGPTRTTWAANAVLARDYFIANQKAYGGWAFTLDPSQNYYGSGNFPWQGWALMQFLRIQYEVTGSSTAKASLKAYIDYVLAEGIDATNDGGYYEDNRFTFCPDYGAEKTGTVTATNGSTAVTGSGTQFQSQYACNGTDTIAIQDSGGNRRGYTVASCSSQTAMVLGSAYAGATESGRRILKYAGAGTTPPSACHSSYGLVSANVSDARTLNNGLHWGFGWAYAEYGTSSYLTNGDRLFAQNLGLGGTGNDGIVGHYADVVSGGSSPSYLAITYLSKEFAFVGGAPGSQSYLAYRLGAAAAASTTSVTVSANRSAITSATKMRVTITQPSGTTATNTCSADTCTVTGLSTRQGTAALMKIEYLSASDAVLAAGSQQPITISQ